jgi:signal transduction histidine kinase
VQGFLTRKEQSVSPHATVQGGSPRSRLTAHKAELVFGFLLIATVLCLVFQDFLFEKRLEINPQSGAEITLYPFTDQFGGGRSKIRYDPRQPFQWSCELKNGYQYPYCGLEVLFDPAGHARGIDLSGYDTLEISGGYSGSSGTLRLYLKNFDRRYSSPGRSETAKFNSVEIPVPRESSIKVNLADLTVADWWLQSEHIPAELSQPQIDNVISLTIQTGSGADLGSHSFRIDGITLHGSRIPHTLFHLLLLGVWIVAGAIYLLFRIRTLKQEVAWRQSASQQIEEMQTQLIHVSRLSAMGEMASALAHELNQPLTAVTSYLSGVQQLLRRADPAEQERALLGVRGALDAAHRAGTTIRRLREMVSGGVDRRPWPVIEIVEQIMPLALIETEHLRLQTRIDVHPGLAVYADKIQVQQVLLNLVRNAIHAMAGEGPRRLIISAIPAEAYVQVSVEDSGHGLTQAIRASLFEAFATTKTDGLGVGLSISRTIVEAHGGKIWADDTPGGGTVFRFTLPSSEEVVERAQDDSAELDTRRDAA